MQLLHCSQYQSSFYLVFVWIQYFTTNQSDVIHPTHSLYGGCSDKFPQQFGLNNHSIDNSNVHLRSILLKWTETENGWQIFEYSIIHCIVEIKMHLIFCIFETASFLLSYQSRGTSLDTYKWFPSQPLCKKSICT